MDSPAADLSQKLSREAESVCRHYLPNGRKNGRYWLVSDVQNTPGRSLYVRLTGPSSGPAAAGKWTDAATGEHGDLLDLIAANLNLSTLRDTLDEARRFLSLPRPDPPRHETLPPVPTGSPEAARRLWAISSPITATLAERYLNQRGIADLQGLPMLRFHPRCYYQLPATAEQLERQIWPALIAKITDTDGTLTGLHRTWLDPDTATKAPLDPNRKAMGNLLGNAVHIGPPCGVVAAGEGLETMLSLRQVLPRMSVAAALSGNHLAAYQPAAWVQRLYIAVDADKTGCIAANRLRDRASEAGIETIMLRPARGDFNGDLRALGIDRLRDNLRAQLASSDTPERVPERTG